MRYVTLFDHGPHWVPGRAVHEQGPPIEGHLRSMRRRYDDGALLLGGPFDTRGGLAVLEVPDAQAATALLDADPAVQAGLLSYRLHRLHAYFDVVAGVRTDGSVAELGDRRRVTPPPARAAR